MNDRDPAVAELLEAARLDTSDSPDWNEVLQRTPGRRAPSRRRVRLVPATAGLAVLLAAIGALFVLAPGGRTTVAGYAIFDRPQTAGDHLPEWVATDPAVLLAGVDPVSTRLAGTDGALRRWLATAVAPGGTPATTRICLIEATDAPPAELPSDDTGPGQRAASGITCRAEDNRLQTVPMAFPPGGGGKGGNVVGFAPDGYDAVMVGARRTGIDNNVFALAEVDGTLPIVATGPAGELTTGLGLSPSPPANPPFTGADGFAPLTRPAGDVVPESVRTKLGDGPIDFGQARLLRDRDGARDWLCPYTGSKTHFWIVSATADGSVTAGTTPIPNRTQPVVAASRGAILYGLVVDGLDHLAIDGTPAPIENNFYVIDIERPQTYSTLRFTGPGGASWTLLEPNMDAFLGDRTALPSRAPGWLSDVIRNTQGRGERDVQYVATTWARANALLGDPPPEQDRPVLVALISGDFALPRGTVAQLLHFPYLARILDLSPAMAGQARVITLDSSMRPTRPAIETLGSVHTIAIRS